MRVKRGQVIPMQRAKPTGPVGGVEEAARLELDEMGATDSFLGQTVLALAGRIDVGGETGAATAALSKELRALMVEVAAKAQRSASPVDMLRQKRLQRMGVAGA